MKNPNVNWSGYLAFAACFTIAIIFFIFIVVLQPGPIDTNKGLPVGISHQENLERKEKWYQSTVESIQRGSEVYSLNCAYCHNETNANVFEKIKSNTLKYGGKQFDLFKTVTRGMEGHHRFEYLLENDRWALVHYLRSMNTELPSSTSSDFKKYIKEGI